MEADNTQNNNSNCKINSVNKNTYSFPYSVKNTKSGNFVLFELF